MNFKYYDILSHLVPGFLVLLVVNQVNENHFSDIEAVPMIALAFIAGYFVNTFSSWLEGFYRFLWGGNPIHSFFDKKGIWKVSFYNGEKVKRILSERVEKQNPSNLILFHEAMRIVNEKGSKRVEDFNAIYAFSRSLLTSILISGLSGLVVYYKEPWYYALFLFLFTIGLVRCKQRNGYYIREVLNTVLEHKNS